MSKQATNLSAEYVEDVQLLTNALLANQREKAALIKREIMKLNDPVLQSGMIGGGGQDVVNAMKDILKVHEEYLVKMENMAEFVNKKLEQLRQTVHASNGRALEVSEEAKKASLRR